MDKIPQEIKDKISEEIGQSLGEYVQEGGKAYATNKIEGNMLKGAEIALDYTADTINKVNQLLANNNKRMEELEKEIERLTGLLKGEVIQSLKEYAYNDEGQVSSDETYWNEQWVNYCNKNNIKP